MKRKKTSMETLSVEAVEAITHKTSSGLAVMFVSVGTMENALRSLPPKQTASSSINALLAVQRKEEDSDHHHLPETLVLMS